MDATSKIFRKQPNNFVLFVLELETFPLGVALLLRDGGDHIKPRMLEQLLRSYLKTYVACGACRSLAAARGPSPPRTPTSSAPRFAIAPIGRFESAKRAPVRALSAFAARF